MQLLRRTIWLVLFARAAVVSHSKQFHALVEVLCFWYNFILFGVHPERTGVPPIVWFENWWRVGASRREGWWWGMATAKPHRLRSSWTAVVGYVKRSYNFMPALTKDRTLIKNLNQRHFKMSWSVDCSKPSACINWGRIAVSFITNRFVQINGVDMMLPLTLYCSCCSCKWVSCIGHISSS